MNSRRKYYRLLSIGAFGLILFCVIAFLISLDWLALFAFGWYVLFARMAIELRCPGCGRRLGELARINFMSGLFLPSRCLFCETSLENEVSISDLSKAESGRGR